MDFNEVLTRRQSCRSYTERPVEKELLNQIMAAGRIAPSSCNTQRWTFIGVNDPDKVRAIRSVITYPDWNINLYADEIPAFIVVVATPPRKDSAKAKYCLKEDYSINYQLDIGIAVGQMLLSATNLGLGTVALGMYEEGIVKAALNIPPELDVALLIAVGYPKDEVIREKVRYPQEEICRFNNYV